jgi:hypothetical protein
MFLPVAKVLTNVTVPHRGGDRVVVLKVVACVRIPETPWLTLGRVGVTQKANLYTR